MSTNYKNMNLSLEPAINHPDLLPPPVVELLNNWTGSTPVEEILVAPIDPEFAGSAEFCEQYGVAPENGANCVIVEAVRGETHTLAACLVPVSCKADINKTAKKILDARKISFAPLEKVLLETGMEYGGVTPIGLPKDYKILIDSRIVSKDRIIVGGGYRKSKISISGKALAELPNAIVVEGLGVEIQK